MQSARVAISGGRSETLLAAVDAVMYGGSGEQVRPCSRFPAAVRHAVLAARNLRRTS